MNDFIKYLKSRIKDKNISCNKLAKLTGLRRQTIASYLEGRTYPKPETCKILAQVFSDKPTKIMLLVQKSKAPEEIKHFFDKMIKTFSA